MSDEDNNRLLLGEFEDEYFDEPRYPFLLRLAFWLTILFCIVAVGLSLVWELSWGSSSGGGCWGFPGEDCT